MGAKYLRRATYTAAALIEQDAIARAPVRTGALRDHIAIFKRKSPNSETVAYAIGIRGIKLNRKIKNVLRIMRKANGTRTNVAGDVFYWRYLEFGTSKMAARPFLRPAFESQKMAAIDVFKTTLADGVAAAAAETKSSA